MTAIAIQELSQNWEFLHSIPEQKKLVTLFFPSVLKNGTS